MNRKEKFETIINTTGQQFDPDEVAEYGGERYIVLFGDESLGNFNVADTLEEVAGCIGDLITSPWGFNGWYDLNEDDLKPHGFTWGINIPLDGDPCAAVACGEAMLGEELP